MRLYGLLLTLSLVLAEVNGNDLCDAYIQDFVEEDLDYPTFSNSSKIQCIVSNINLLSCSWSTKSPPEDEQYSASFQLYNTTKEHPLNCSSKDSEQLVECQSRINDIFEYEDVVVKVNISKNGSWEIKCQHYTLEEIEKLDPPQNIRTAIKSTNLEIQWSQPNSCCSTQDKCFNYELKINDESVLLKKLLAYNITNFERTTRYTIQIRTKHDRNCINNDKWSDWSKDVVYDPPVIINPHYAAVIASIVIVLPMILLAFLLGWKFLRLFDKLLPSIPNPSKNVQMLLEKNDFYQVLPPKQCEEGAEILEVTG